MNEKKLLKLYRKIGSIRDEILTGETAGDFYLLKAAEGLAECQKQISEAIDEKRGSTGST